MRIENMRCILLTLFMTSFYSFASSEVSATPSEPVETVDDIIKAVLEHKCSEYSGLAKLIMTYRQKGLPIDNLRDVCESRNDVLRLCQDAYSTPVSKYTGEQNAYIGYFTIDAYDSCINKQLA
ncbi:hypothetical protein NMS14_001798, partial [Vibrio cholerae]|nr:hypothetical protein [Vibrio cholerae]